MLTVVATSLMWGVIVGLMVKIARDVRALRRYKNERAGADALASRAIDCLIIGDVDEATRLARRSREWESKALDTMVS